MTTDVDQAFELITAALAGMAVLIVLLVLAERVILRPPVLAPAAVETQDEVAVSSAEAAAPATAC